MFVIITFFMVHWWGSLLCQSLFLHRYSAHQSFTTSKGWERFFYISTWIMQGSSYLPPRAYAILHREHHAFSDTEKDPHSPHVYRNVFTMMFHTYQRFNDLLNRQVQPEARFEGGIPEWPRFDRVMSSWPVRLAWFVPYTLVYVLFAPHWAFFLLLPIHYVMGPVHGAIVNWCGHKYGYRNFETKDGDKSRNTLIFDFVTGGELFQNNHHRHPTSPNFAMKWFEVDPGFQVLRVLSWLRIVKLKKFKRPLEEVQPVSPSATPQNPLSSWVETAASAETAVPAET